MQKQIFGAFLQNEKNPLSRISQANSCISLDPFTGCSLGCVYCYRHNSKRDNNSFIPKRLFSDEEIIKALINHPYFIPNKTIIGIGVASTDAFLPKVENSSFNIMNILSKKGYKNPFWFVIKSGIPKKSSKKFKNIINRGNHIIFSISYSGMPKIVEPFSGNRFNNIDEAIEAGASVSLHLRPLVLGWNDDYKNLERVIKKGIANGCTSVCYGGLRFGWYRKAITQRYGLAFPKINKNELMKTMPIEIEQNIKNIFKKHDYHIPLFSHSSEVISHYLGIKDYNMNALRGRDYFLKINEKDANTLGLNNDSIKILIQQAIDELKINSKVFKKGDKYFLSKRINYIEERALIHRLSFYNFL